MDFRSKSLFLNPILKHSFPIPKTSKIIFNGLVFFFFFFLKLNKHSRGSAKCLRLKSLLRVSHEYTCAYSNRYPFVHIKKVITNLRLIVSTNNSIANKKADSTKRHETNMQDLLAISIKHRKPC